VDQPVVAASGMLEICKRVQDRSIMWPLDDQALEQARSTRSIASVAEGARQCCYRRW
jgi:hypothetical protein